MTAHQKIPGSIEDDLKKLFKKGNERIAVYYETKFNIRIIFYKNVPADAVRIRYGHPLYRSVSWAQFISKSLSKSCKDKKFNPWTPAEQ